MIISKEVGRTYAIFSAPIGNVFKRAAKERMRVLLNEIEGFGRIIYRCPLSPSLHQLAGPGAAFISFHPTTRISR